MSKHPCPTIISLLLLPNHRLQGDRKMKAKKATKAVEEVEKIESPKYLVAAIRKSPAWFSTAVGGVRQEETERCNR
jgi:hypothetical protein